MAQWDFLHPAEGHSINLGSSIGHLSILKGMIQTTENTALEGFNAVKDDVWIGKGRATWRNSTRLLVDALPDVKAAFESAQTAVTNYKSAFDGIKIDFDREYDKLSDARTIVFSPTLYYPPDPRVPADVIVRAIATRHMAEAQSAIYALAGRRLEADHAFVSAMTRALPESWEQTRAAFAAIGITSTADLSPEVIGVALAELGRQGIDLDNAAAREQLAALLEIYGTDEAVMSQFFQELGGEDTLLLIDTLGDQYAAQAPSYYDDAALALAQQLRSALSVGSQSWDAGVAQAFAGTMLNTDANYLDVDGNAAIAYLFGDKANAPMGAQLALATAEAIDQYESDGGVLDSFDARSTEGGNALYLAELPGGYIAPVDGTAIDYDPGITDGAGRVFDTLSLYPDQALDFLSPGGGEAQTEAQVAANLELQSERINRWFGEREWTYPDGWEGASSLWLSSLQSENALKTDPPDLALSAEMAAVSTLVINALSDNLDFVTEHLNDDVARTLATAIGMHIDAFGASFHGGDGSGIGENDLTFNYTELGSNEAHVGPNPALEKLGDVLGQIAATDAGALRLATITAAYEQTYANAAAGGDLEVIQQASVRILGFGGLLDGAGVGATLGEAARDDAALAELIAQEKELWQDLFGLVPVDDAVEVALPGLGYVIGQGVGQGTDMVIDGVVDWVHRNEWQYEAAAADADQQRTDYTYAAKIEFGQFLYEHMGVTGVPPFTTPESDPNYLADGIIWYDSLVASGELDLGALNAEMLENMYESNYEAGAGTAE